MTDDYNIRITAPSQEDKTLLTTRMIRIVLQKAILIQEHRLCLVKRDSMLVKIASGLFNIPDETNIAHIIIV